MVTHSEEDKKRKNLTWSKFTVFVPYLAKITQLLFQINKKNKIMHFISYEKKKLGTSNSHTS